MKVGDSVKCVFSDNSADLLEKDGIYTVKLVAGKYIKLDETPDHFDWLISRFVLIPDYFAITRSVA